jgi:predicted transcriptional regulator
MPRITIDLSEDEGRRLDEVARMRDIEPASLLQRWIRERLVHEQERAAGGGKDLSPRARREQASG